MIYAIRHAEKMSEEGLKNAFEYGKSLKISKMNLNYIFSSPMQRCLQTAQQIAKSYVDIVISKTKLLGEPSIYICDSEKVKKIFTPPFILEDIISKHLENKTLLGFCEINQASGKFCKFFLKNKNKNALCISHDIIINTFFANLLQKNHFKKEELLGFLEGFYLDLTKLEILKYLNTLNTSNRYILNTYKNQKELCFKP